ncbi:MAG TPA: hypothetical protein VHO73_12535, partial [Methylomirabilota bacterium]|nr:hypothetical protein [Methylomirabilota bacterium]
MKRARIGIVLLGLVAGLVFAGTAMADDPGYIDQYQEPLPTGGGNEHTGGNGNGGGSGGSGAFELPSATQENLSSSVSAPVAEALESVATSPELGAPQGTIRKREKAGQGDAGPGSGSGSSDPVVVRVEPLEGSPLTDAVAAATDG